MARSKSSQNFSNKKGKGIAKYHAYLQETCRMERLNETLWNDRNKANYNEEDVIEDEIARANPRFN
jgi:hypothetical protein